MKHFLLLALLCTSVSAFAQKEGDTTYKRCPVSITDTATGNNYFIDHQPAIVKAYRNRGNLTFRIEQKNQYFTIIFHVKKLKTKGKYEVKSGDGARDEVTAKYSFTSGESVAYADVSGGTAETSFDKVTKLWHIKLMGYVSSLGDTRASYFKAKADFYVE